MREKVFRNSSGFRFNVSFVDCTSVFVKSVLETSLSGIDEGLKNELKFTFVLLTGASAIIDLFTALNKPPFTRHTLSSNQHQNEEILKKISHHRQTFLVHDWFLIFT